MEQKCKIYFLSGIDNIPKYIGKTKRILKNRRNEHISNAKLSKNKTHKINWIRSLNYEINITLIEECDFVVSDDREIYWIQYYKNLGYKLTNGTLGGEHGHIGYKGRKCSDETKHKLSIANKGRILDDEWKKKIGLSQKGKVLTDDVKKRMSLGRTGLKVQNYKTHKCSDEAKQKISKANTGKKRTQEVRDIYKIQIECPHCGKLSNKGNAGRWHFDNCKQKNNYKQDGIC